MDARDIRGWLLVHPRPVALRITSVGSKAPQMLATNTGATWAEMGKSVEALSPELIEALDAQGQVIRAVRPADVDDEDEEDEAEVIPVMQGHPESLMLITFAKLIADAYKHSTDVAFARLGDLFNAMTARSIALERSLDSTMKLQLRNALEGNGAPEGEGGLQEIMSAFMQGQAKRAMEDAARGAVNGAKEPTS